MWMKKDPAALIVRCRVDMFSEKFGLTAGEKNVIQFIASGQSLQGSACRVGRSIKTLSTQKRMAYKKMNILNDVELIYLLFADVIFSTE